MYILGLDGGGTKTKATLLHPENGICWKMEAGATNPHSMGFLPSVQTVISMIEKACLDNELSEESELYVSLGVAGLGREAEQRKWLQLFYANVPHQLSLKEITIENDGKIALYAGTYGADGIVSICGTGALTFGVYDGRQMRVGGWGHLVGGDPGSGYDIGLQVLKAVFEQEDGVGASTLMTALLLEKANVKCIPDLIPFLYAGKQEKQQVAALAPIMFEAVQQGDDVAQHIMQQTAEKIAQNGWHVYQKLFASKTSEQKVPFVLAGGIFQNEQMVQQVVTALRKAPSLTVIVGQREPVMGGIAIVLRRKGYQTKDIMQILLNREEGETSEND